MTLLNTFSPFWAGLKQEWVTVNTFDPFFGLIENHS